MNVFVVGVGLIGGSFALDLKELNSNVIIHGIDINESHLQEAMELGVIDQKSSYENLSLADVVVISIPVNACK